jgi:hypothetical protein
MPLYWILFNRFGTAEPPVGASIAFYESNPILSRGRDKSDISPESTELDVEIRSVLGIWRVETFHWQFLAVLH